MATVKPVQPSVVDDINIWKKIVSKALTPPTKEQLEKMHKLCEKYERVCIDDRHSSNR